MNRLGMRKGTRLIGVMFLALMLSGVLLPTASAALASGSFESGNREQWSGITSSSGETVEIVSWGESHDGNYHARFATNGGSTDNAYLYKTMSEDDVYARGYFNVMRGLPLSDSGDYFTMLRVRAGSTVLGAFGVRRVSGSDRWLLQGRDGSSLRSTTSSSSVQEDRWYSLELHWRSSSTGGVVEAWVDGQKVLSLTGLDTNNYGDAKYVDFGVAASSVQGGSIVYADTYEMSTGYIGPVGASPPPPSTPPPTEPNPPTTPTNPGEMVVSSELLNFYYMSSSEVDTFLNLIKQQGFTEVTLRLNAMNEWSSGKPVSSGVSKTKEIVTKAAQRGIAVNIDLHTWCTTWDNYFDDSASNNAANRQKYLTYIANTLDAFSSVAISSFMILNEPQAQKASSSENQFLLNCISTAKQHTSKPVSIRFMAGYSPSTGHYDSNIDTNTDFLCRNSYWDPRRPSTTIYGTTEAKMLDAINAAHSRDKEIWISEFGKTNTNQSEQVSYIRSLIDWAEAHGIDNVCAWAMQPEDPSGSTYNLFGTNYKPLPAFYELE